MKNIISLALVLSLLGVFQEDLLAKERKGVHIVVYSADVSPIDGELIAVKKNSLLILDSLIKRDVSVDIGNIKTIRIIKKSKALVGIFAGGALGASLGYAGYSKSTFFDPGPGSNAIFWGVIGGLAGLATGKLLGKDETLQIEGISDDDIWWTLQYLRSKARVSDYY